VEPVLRVATPADVAAVVALRERSWRAAYAGLVPPEAFERLGSPEVVQRWRHGLDDPNRAAVLCVAGDQLLGFTTYGPSRDDDLDPGSVGELYAIYLDPDVWRGGVGSLLLADVIRGLTDRGYRRAALWTIEGNDRARRFYEKHGWTHDGHEHLLDFDGVPIPEVRYTRDLPGATT
jgi:GNAT superfamily N-acetyltransferase